MLLKEGKIGVTVRIWEVNRGNIRDEEPSFGFGEDLREKRFSQCFEIAWRRSRKET